MFSLNKIIYSIAISIFLLIPGIQAEETADQTAHPNWGGMTQAMQKSMDPNVWSQMMAMMMDPQKSSPIATCALCHQDKDVARYQKDFGGMMDAMWQPYQSMMNPHMMSSMMNPNAYMSMMNPATYMNMMYPMMGMMGPMMGMGGPMMNPAMYMNMMYPMMGMMGPMMGMGAPMMGMGAPMMNPGGHMMNNPMDPKQYEQWFGQWTDMMKNFVPQTPQAQQ